MTVQHTTLYFIPSCLPSLYHCLRGGGFFLFFNAGIILYCRRGCFLEWIIWVYFHFRGEYNLLTFYVFPLVSCCFFKWNINQLHRYSKPIELNIKIFRWLIYETVCLSYKAEFYRWNYMKQSFCRSKTVNTNSFTKFDINQTIWRSVFNFTPCLYRQAHWNWPRKINWNICKLHLK